MKKNRILESTSRALVLMTFIKGHHKTQINISDYHFLNILNIQNIILLFKTESCLWDESGFKKVVPKTEGLLVINKMH